MGKSSIYELLMAYVEKHASKEEMAEIKEDMQRGIFANPPKVAIIGKAGVGKTTTINNLFSADEYVSDVYRGTTQAVMKRFPLKGGLDLEVYDMPGLGDDIDKDKEFEAMYKEVLPQCDIIIYILEALDGSFEEDIKILRDVVLTSCENVTEKILVALNKVDMIGNNEGLKWDYRINRPNSRQSELIEEKLADVQRRLTTVLPIDKDRIVCYSAIKKYRLLEFFKAMVTNTKDAWKFVITGNLPKDWTNDIPQKYKDMAKKLGILPENDNESYSLD